MADSDIFRAAKPVIDQHGEDAPLHSAQWADDLLEGGDVDGARIRLGSWGRSRS